MKILDYNAIEVKMRNENVKNVVIDLDKKDKNLFKKIQTYSCRFGYSETEIHKKIREDKMFRAFFAKEPKRQRLHEAVAGKYLRQFEIIKIFKFLIKIAVLWSTLRQMGILLMVKIHKTKQLEGN